MPTIKLPELSEGIDEAEILEWHVEPGQHLEVGQLLVSLETDKAVVDIPSPKRGKITGILANAGDLLRTGQPLIELEATESAEFAAADESTDRASDVSREDKGIIATDDALSLARALKIDLGSVSPTKPDGLITKTDVERAAKKLEEVGPVQKLRGMRRAMARRMEGIHASAATATIMDDADLQAWPCVSDVTIRLLRAVVAGCRAEPSLNAWFNARTMERRIIQQIDVGLVIDTENGLITPVIRDVGNRDDDGLRRALDKIKIDIEARSVSPEDLHGATITLGNLGPLARRAVLMVDSPQVATVCAGRISSQVVACGSKIEIHKVMPLSLTFDHRTVNGKEAAGFLSKLAENLELSD